MARLSVNSTSRMIASVVVCLAAGCGSEPAFELALARGSVTIDGQPLREGKVMFAPAGESGQVLTGKAAFGRLQSDGTFRLTTYEDGDGAVVGPHWVTIIGRAPRGPEDGPASDLSQLPLRGASRVRVPRQVRVERSEENVVTIALTRQEVEQYGERDD